MMFNSVVKDQLDAYVKYLRSYKDIGEIGLNNLKYFDRHCCSYTDAQKLTQEMVDSWCACRDTETAESCSKRITSVRSFIKYARQRGLTDVMAPSLPRGKRESDFVPHSFTDEELKKFFHECDSITLPHNCRLIDKLRKITLPVFFRLLYSTGIRTVEARNLKRDDVDLLTGMIHIRKSKGPDQHAIVVHQTMLNILAAFDAAADKLVPNRNYFFSTAANGCYTRQWETYDFQELWKKVSDAKARPYDFRANYVQRKIDSWTDAGMNWYNNLIFLRKSLGHVNLDHTAHYYNVTESLYDVLENNGTSSLLDDLLNENQLIKRHDQ